MSDDRDTEPQTAVMRDGAEVEKDARDDDAEHHPRTQPADIPLTTDSEAQQDDSVIQPDTA